MNSKLVGAFLLIFSINLVRVPAQGNPFADESKSSLLEVLQSDADTFAKAKACERLALIGDESCIDALATLLGDPKLDSYALNALQQISGERVDAALLSAMQSHSGSSRIAIIQAIGERKVEAAAEQLVDLCRMADVASNEKQAAIRALGMLGKTAPLQQIESRNPLEARTIQDAILLASSETNRQNKSESPRMSEGDFRQILASLDLQSSRTAVLNSLDKLTPTRQVLAMNALANLDSATVADDKLSSHEIVVKLAESEDLEVASAAVLLLATHGYFHALNALPSWLESRPDLIRIALPLLSQVENHSLDRDVIARLGKAKSSDSVERTLGLIEYVGARRLPEATPALLQLAMDSNEAVANAAIGAAGYTASIDQFGDVLDLLTKLTAQQLNQTDRDVCMSRACVRLPRDAAASVIENELKDVRGEVALWLINSLAQLGGKEALAVVTRAAQSGDDTRVDGATRALGEWLSADVAVPLEELASTLPPGNYRTRALRAYLRVGRQFDMPSNDRIQLCRRALQLADRDDERLLVVDILHRNPSLESANVLLEILREPNQMTQKLKKQALAALTSIAEKVSDADAKVLHAALVEAGILSEHESARERLHRFAE